MSLHFFAAFHANNTQNNSAKHINDRKTWLERVPLTNQMPSNGTQQHYLFFVKKLFYHYGYRKQLIMFEIKNQLKSYFFT